MRKVIKEVNVYKFGECPEVDDKIRDNMHYNWDLYEHRMKERIDTLNKVADLLGGELNYSISCVPDRGEFIKIKPKNDHDLDFNRFWEFINVDKECPLTGVCYDHDLIDHISKYRLNDSGLQYALDQYLDTIHDEYESMLTDEYLQEFCDSNDYEFTEDGELF